MLMSKYFKMHLRRLITSIFMVFVFNMAIAQPTGPGGTDPGDCNDCPPSGAVPVDGGLTFLAAAGIAYGARKANRRKKG